MPLPLTISGIRKCTVIYVTSHYSHLTYKYSFVKYWCLLCNLRWLQTTTSYRLQKYHLEISWFSHWSCKNVTSIKIWPVMISYSLKETTIFRSLLKTTLSMSILLSIIYLQVLQTDLFHLTIICSTEWLHTYAEISNSMSYTYTINATCQNNVMFDKIRERL